MALAAAIACASGTMNIAGGVFVSDLVLANGLNEQRIQYISDPLTTGLSIQLLKEPLRDCSILSAVVLGRACFCGSVPGGFDGFLNGD